MSELFNAQAERDAGMAQVDQADNAAFEAWVRNRIFLGHKGGEFTTDMIWDRLQKENGPMPHDNRALGPIMVRLAKEKLIDTTGRYVKSTRRHCSPIPVWRIL